MQIHFEPCFPSDMVLGQLVTERSGRENGIVLSFSSQPPWSNMVMHPVLRAQNPQPRRCGSTVGQAHPAVMIMFLSFWACIAAGEPAGGSVTHITQHPTAPFFGEPAIYRAPFHSLCISYEGSIGPPVT